MNPFRPIVLLLPLLLAEPSVGEPPVGVTIVPSEAEWLTWPPYCRARYALTLYARGTKYAGSAPPEEITRWKWQLGDAWTSLHHFCYGLVQVSRAPTHSDPNKRAYLYGRALDEFKYAYRSLPNTHPFAAEIGIQIALAADKSGDEASAIDYFKEVMSLHPTLEGSYLGMSLIERRKGQLNLAKGTLEQGLRQVTHPSPQLHYFLGLTLFDLKEYSLAREHADKALALGYPLRGLQKKLQSVGR